MEVKIALMPIEDDVPVASDPPPPIAWMKIADPDTVVPTYPTGTDVRVLIPTDARFADLRESLLAQRVPFREVPYLLEQEVISNTDPQARLTATVETYGRISRSSRALAGAAAEAARDGFDLMWHNIPARRPPPSNPFLPTGSFLQNGCGSFPTPS
ncbi:hypothetical protein AB0E01_43810 [Nocardia vinacea]|uniref:hypothetical protein n=1 Tax=Nocardia vinacea TaxID=96468 RepID=UPI0033CD1BB8